MTNRALILIYTEKQVRTFLETKCFELLSQEVELDFVLQNLSTIDEQLICQKNNVFYLTAKNGILGKSGTLLSSVRLWKFRNRSQAHFNRAVASFARKKMRTSFPTMILYSMEGWSDFKRFLIRLLAKSNLLNLVVFFRKYIVRRSLKTRVRTAGIDLNHYRFAIVPFSGLLSSEFDDLTDFFQSRKIPVVAIQENWDNLSSKTFIASSPKYFLVWGEQSQAHLKLVHRQISTLTHVAGSPRFLAYQNKNLLHSTREDQHIVRSKLAKRDFILVTGTGDGIDDFLILTQTRKALGELPQYTDLAIIYRPHPFTRNKIDFDSLHSEVENGVIIDETPRSKNVFYHTSLVADAKLVINQFSTILLEALFSNNKVLLPTFVNRPVKYDYSKAVNEWFHFIGLKALPNVFISTSPDTYKTDLIKALNTPNKDSFTSSSWFISAKITQEEILHFYREYLSS